MLYKKIILVFVFFVAIISTDVLASTKEIDLVRNGVFDIMKSVSIADLFGTVFCDDGQWTSILADDGFIYVNAIYIDDEFDEWFFQFRTYANQRFELTYIQILDNSTYDEYEMLSIIATLIEIYNLM